MTRLLLSLFAALALTGCAAMNQLTSEVSTFSQWPADRKPASYAFERLPSQAAQPERMQLLEDAARPAIEAAGFTPATDLESADVTVQVGARVAPNDPYPWADPFWWRGSVAFGHRSAYFRGGFWAPFGPTPTYAREVGVLIRDRKTGQPLYEARATNDGTSPSINSLLPAMFEAALTDFPNTGVNPRRVVTPIGNR
jgi:hypothetical protein